MTLLKSMVLGLVLANAAYFLWARGIANPADAPAPAGSAPGLTLASESPALARTLGTDTPPPAAATAVDSAATVDSAESAPPGSPALLTNVKRCISVGPFRDVSEAARAAATLRGGHYDPRQRVAEGEVWAGVWVYLPISPAQGSGDQMLTKLKAGGIDDALEMPGPDDASVISLGLYSETKRAQARVAQAKALGFNPGIADRKRSGDVYWIDLDLKPTDALLNPAELQGEAGRIVRLEVKGCPSAPGAAS